MSCRGQMNEFTPAKSGKSVYELHGKLAQTQLGTKICLKKHTQHKTTDGLLHVKTLGPSQFSAI